MVFDKDFLDELQNQARLNIRKRMNYDLRNSSEDGSQRMLNALEPGTVLPIHRHRHSSETVVLLRGRMDEVFYDDQKREIARYHLNTQEDCYGLNIPVGQWHGIEVFEPSIIVEMKNGSYNPICKEDVLE